MSTPVQSVDDFLQVIRRSGLVEEARLMAVVEPWIGHAAAPPEPLLQALEDSGLLTRWQIDQLLKGRYKGFTLGKYRLLRLLGAGGMSSVYLGEHATLHSKAAVKVLPVKRVEQSSYLARFEREARQSARLNHPNIVRTFDLDTAGSIHFIAMEYVDGIDLHAKVKRDGPLPIREVAEYIRQAAIGLQHAHEEGLVHRDIKPANLILDTRGTVKILDLGLALAGGDEDGSLTREHDEKVLGTADYLAPEQATDSHKADRRSDVYSLGCTLYYLLIGKAPFATGKLSDRLQSHLHKPPPNLLDDRPDVPIAITELYFRMLEKHPDGRPQSAREVADARRGGRSARDEARSHRCGDKARSHRYGEDTLAGYSDNAGTGRCGRSAWASHGDQRGAWRMGCGQCTPHVAVLFCSVPSRSRLGFWKAFPERVALRSDKTSRAVEIGTRMRRNRSTFHGPLARVRGVRPCVRSDLA